MSQYFTMKMRPGGIAVITMMAPGEGPNVMGRAWGEALEALVPQLEKSEDIKGLVMISGHPDFMVGADVREFDRFPSEDEFRETHKRITRMMDRMAKLPYPTVAGLCGMTLGGGLELALGFGYRVVSDDPPGVIGLPEVNIGLIPGLGGTQRLPRLIGLQPALDMILTGKRVFPKKALKMGLVDRLAPRSILEEACVRLAQDVIDGKFHRRKKPVSDVFWKSMGKGILRTFSEKAIQEKTRGLYKAPLIALDTVLAGINRPLDEALEIEREAFVPLLFGRVSKALRHILLSTMDVKKRATLSGEAGSPRKVEQLGVIGAGLMGAGIAMVALDRGTRVRLKDQNAGQLAKGLKSVSSHYNDLARKGVLEKHLTGVRLGHLTACTDYAQLADCDLVIEAVFEKLELKRDVIRELQQSSRGNAVIASNTSSIPIARLAEGAIDPTRIVGMHFFSPVPKMPLIEVIVPPQASPEAVATVVDYGRKMGKTVILVKDGPGFFTTRVIGRMFNEIIHIFFQGADVEEVDHAMMAIGFPVGPFQLLDEVGLDVGAKVNEVLKDAFGERFLAPSGWDKVMADNRLGRKTGKGFYRYVNGKRGGVDESVYSYRAGRGMGARPSPNDIQERALLAFVQETLLCLQEGILPSPVEGDLGAIMGLGFPPLLGGPFHYVDQQGAPAIVKRLEALQKQYPERFAIPEILQAKARESQPFHRREEVAAG